ncbi:MAG: hypothetical protein H6Q02_1485 [Acidobacteria bacterium]|nr:hypothetical protein [Acidobacteriota bacterium]
MIKFLQCVRRREDLSPADFVRFWSQYREAVDAVGEATQAVRVTASRTLAVPQNTQLAMARGTGSAFDGVIEVWWERGGDVIADLDQPGIAAQIEAMRRLQAEFMDLEQSSFFFTSEDVLFERGE